MVCPRTAASPPGGASVAGGTAALLAAGACDFLEWLGWLGGISRGGGLWVVWNSRGWAGRKSNKLYGEW